MTAQVESQYVIDTSQAIASDLYQFLVTSGVTTITEDQLYTVVKDYYDGQQRAQINLSTVKPDIRAIVEQLQQELGTRDTWKDTLSAATGQFIIDAIAGVGGLNQFAIETGQYETMLKTAALTSSVIVNARDMGVHIIRKTPAQVTCSLTNSDTTTPVTIDAYSSFSINSEDYFNREAINFNVGVSTQVVTLYQGTVTTEEFDSTGEIFQRYEIGEEDFSISDVDILCYVGVTEYTRIIDGLWHYTGTDTVFYENTLPSGNVEVTFGNNLYGASPQIGNVITFTYVSTKGFSGNLASTGLTVSCGSYPTISGTTTSVVYGGADQPNAEFYKVLAPSAYSSKLRAVTRADHKAIGMQYPGMIDALFLGQAETYPADKDYMNVVQITPFLTNTGTAWTTGETISATGVYRINASKLYVSASTGTTGSTAPTHITGTVSDGGVDWTFVGFTVNAPMSSGQFTDFVAYLQGTSPYTTQYSIYNMQYIQLNPDFVNTTITADVYCTLDSQLANLQAYIINSIQSLTAPGINCIGKSWYLSDIYDMIDVQNTSYGSVDWIDLTLPTADVTAAANEIVLFNPTITLNMYYTERS